MTSTAAFYEDDLAGTLFPLKTNLLLIQTHSTELSEYIYQRVLNTAHPEDNFLPQQRAYATKPHGHLRRTAKLDPVAEYFIYDIMHRNRGIFRPEVSNYRRSFGYRFKDGRKISVHAAYMQYQQEMRSCFSKHDHNIHFDIASFFNSMYHHDVAHWFEAKEGVTDIDAFALSQFFREINSGRSVDFMPQGIYPAKMIGNEFLKFLDLNGLLKSNKIVRFMDDITLFDDSTITLQSDFYRIQQLLGQFALNINPSKTTIDAYVGDVHETLSDIQESLKEIVTEYEEIPTASGVEVTETEYEVESSLSDEQVERLLALLGESSLEEEDAEFILRFLRTHSDSLLEQLPILLRRFPNLIKHIHSVCSGVTDKSGLASIIWDYLNEDRYFLEFQLFWIGTIVDDYLLGHGCYGEILVQLHELTSDFKIARAKVLEIPEQGFGLKELRAGYLKTGQADWLSWSSAAGSRNLKPTERNYALSYFAKASSMNFLVSEGVKKTT